MSASQLEGRLERDDFAGPVMILVTDAGERWQLRGGVDPGSIGRRIRVEGAPAAEQFGFVMVGPIFDVSRVTLID
jgi:hypothetical protein